MAVTVVDTGTATYQASATTHNYTFTVSSGATLAVFYIAEDVTQTVTSVTWDSGGTNQACTLVGSEPCSTATLGKIFIYAVVNPTVGASKTLAVVLGTATGLSAQLQSYSGTDTTSVATACTNVLVLNGAASGSIGTAAQSGATGNMFVSAYTGQGAITTPSDTSIYALAPAGNDAVGNRFLSAGASHTLTAQNGTALQWCAVSCNIVASTVTDVLNAQIWM